MQFLNWRKQVFKDSYALLSRQTWRAMRLIVILLTVTFLHAGAKGYTQDKVTLNLKNAPLEKVFSEIRKQTLYDFFYKESLIHNAR
jgi:TonB-dependent starch-binding outer membrane protein SusC